MCSKESIGRLPALGIIGNSDLLGKKARYHLPPTAPRLIVLIDNRGISTQKHGYRFPRRFYHNLGNTWRRSVKFERQLIVPIKFFLFTRFDAHPLGIGNTGITLVHDKSFFLELSSIGFLSLYEESPRLGPHGRFSGRYGRA